ncbi:MAG TPA: outer membrane beta-barrel protein [Parvibaculum sp.]
MKKLAIVAAVAGCAISFSASADEMSGGSAANWGGFYAGVNAGAAVNNEQTDYGYSYLPGNGTGNFSDAFGNAADNTPGGSGTDGPLNVVGLNAVQSAKAQGILVGSLGSSNHSVFIGGAQAGFNWQMNNFVFGPEADLAYLGDGERKGYTGTTTPPPPGGFTNSGSSRSSVDWLSTVRLRAGYAFDRALVYATGGLAFGGVKSESSSVGTDGSTTDTFYGSKSETRTGWALGGGLEYAIDDHWTARVEGLYYDLGSVSYAVAPQDLASAAEGLSTTASHKFDGSIFRIGLNYRF